MGWQGLGFEFLVLVAGCFLVNALIRRFWWRPCEVTVNELAPGGGDGGPANAGEYLAQVTYTDAMHREHQSTVVVPTGVEAEVGARLQVRQNRRDPSKLTIARGGRSWLFSVGIFLVSLRIFLGAWHGRH